MPGAPASAAKKTMSVYALPDDQHADAPFSFCDVQQTGRHSTQHAILSKNSATKQQHVPRSGRND